MAISSYDLPPLTPLDIFGREKGIEIIRHIKGTPVVVNFMMNEFIAMENSLSDAEIKLRLCNEIAAELYKQNMIEFTKEQRADTGDIHYRARIFAVPNTDVQLLREQEIIK
jgi:hypothetical protein